MKFTCVIIAHRLKSIKKSDRIYVLNEGKMIEEGTHDVLMNKQGHYFNLMNSQENLTDNDEKSQNTPQIKYEEEIKEKIVSQDDSKPNKEETP